MSGAITEPVLIIGGSGVVGAMAATALRRLHPDLPLAIGGRDLAKAESVASQVGNAVAVSVDLADEGLGLPAGTSFSAVVVFVKDDGFNSARYAQAHRIPYLSLSSSSFEIAPEVGLYIRNPTAAPMVLASQWLAGAATLPALHFASGFDAVETLRLTALLDDKDMGGAAAYADYDRFTSKAPFAMIRHDYDFFWSGGEMAKSTFRDSGGVEHAADAYSPLDAVSLAAATGARAVRLDLALGETPASRRGEHFSTEIGIEIRGTKRGKAVDEAYRIIHPQGQAPLTALFVALCVERMLGLSSGDPVPAGLYTPDVIVNPAYAVERLREFGADVRAVIA